MDRKSLALIVAGLVILAGAWAIIQSTSSEPASKTKQTSSAPQLLEVELTVKKGVEDVKTVRLEQGQKVVVTVTSDFADEVHFHGYELHFDAGADKPAKLEFMADRTGRFEMEMEHVDQKIAIFEVYPR